MDAESAIVNVIDPDVQAQTAVSDLAASMNLQCRAYGTGQEFFAEYTDSQPGCLVLEVRIPDMGGYQIQRRLAANHAMVPLIFLSSSADVSLAVELLRGGAVHYLQKPMRPLDLINAIHEALAIDRSRRETCRQRRAILESIAVLSSKERDVLRLIADGRPNQQIAAELRLGLRTVELRRASLMKKLSLKSPLELLHFALLAQRDGSRYLEDYYHDAWGRYSMTLASPAEDGPPSFGAVSVANHVNGSD